MTHDDEVCLKLGREVVRMIHDVRKVSQGDTAYTRRTFTFPGGEVEILIVNDSKLADLFDAAADDRYHVQPVASPSQKS